MYYLQLGEVKYSNLILISEKGKTDTDETIKMPLVIVSLT